jgi:hypothetical protein
MPEPRQFVVHHLDRDARRHDRFNYAVPALLTGRAHP